MCLAWHYCVATIAITSLALSTAVAAAPVQTGVDLNGHVAAAQLASRDGVGFARLKNGVQFRIGAVSRIILNKNTGEDNA
ncbi:hypothetical protein LJR289_001504 [Pseudoduganella sp. LjRoot289]|uniref:hypothetical protein n=1 Tax=Pseudoduganella sp. LjRoot289 TaxID=3342314 RepID=UPI003ECD76B9